MEVFFFCKLWSSFVFLRMCGQAMILSFEFMSFGHDPSHTYPQQTFWYTLVPYLAWHHYKRSNYFIIHASYKMFSGLFFKTIDYSNATVSKLYVQFENNLKEGEEKNWLTAF